VGGEKETAFSGREERAIPTSEEVSLSEREEVTFSVRAGKEKGERNVGGSRQLLPAGKKKGGRKGLVKPAAKRERGKGEGDWGGEKGFRALQVEREGGTDRKPLLYRGAGKKK